MTTVLCCPRTRPHTNFFYYFSRDEATQQEGVAFCPSVMLLERFCFLAVEERLLAIHWRLTLRFPNGCNWPQKIETVPSGP